MKRNYQEDYAAGRPQMYDESSRVEKGRHIVKTLADYYGSQKLKDKVVLDVGASTGIIDNYLADHFKKVIGTDIDKKAIAYAKKKFKKKNLIFKTEDAMKLSFKDNSLDIVICTHVYEHVPSAKKLFQEIYRVLKPDGLCYLAAVNALSIIEPHHNLPFLSYLPKNIANIYIRLRGKNEYYETPLTYWGLMTLLTKFSKVDYTSKIIMNPEKFGYKYKKLNNAPYPIKLLLSKVSRYISPTTFWLLIK